MKTTIIIVINKYTDKQIGEMCVYGEVKKQDMMYYREIASEQYNMPCKVAVKNG